MPRSACRRLSGHSPGPAAKGWRATSSTIPTPCAAAACSTSPAAPAWSPSRRPRQARHRSSPPTSTRSRRRLSRMNAAANGVALAYTVRRSDRHGSWLGVVLAGDVFYDSRWPERLTPWFDALARRGATVLIGDPGRSYLPRQRLEPLAVYQIAGDARAGGCRGQAHDGLALRLTLSGWRRSIPATESGRHA